MRIGWWQRASIRSSSRDLPQRFSGALITSRGAVFQAGTAWVAAIHSTTAAAACVGGQDDVAAEGGCDLVQQLGARRAKPVGVDRRGRVMRWPSGRCGVRRRRG